MLLKTVFAVIDPTTTNQRALDRAMRIAKITGAKIHAYLCIYSDIEANDQQELMETEISRYEPWLDRIVEPVRAEGLEVTTRIEWNKDWYNAIAPAAKAVNSDLIVKPTHGSYTTSDRLLMKSSDQALFRKAQCPVFLIKSEAARQSHRVLIAVDAKRDDARYKSIREKVIEYGKWITSAYEDGELHAVHSYSDQDEYVHVRDMAKLTGLDTKYVHVIGDEPEQAIAKKAKEIDAQIIIIGLSTQSTLINRVFGSTGEWLLNNLDYDLLVIFPEEE